MNYRERCYRNFVSSHWKYSHIFSQETYNLFAKASRKRLKGILPDDKEAKIIDIACGAGHFLYFLQQEGYINTRGIDLSEEQLEVANKMGVKNLEKADLFEYLPKHPQSFDLVVANDIIEHLKKDEVLEFLDIIYHSLVPGGQLLLGTVNAQSLFGASTVFIDFTHEQGFTTGSLAQVMRVCNFKDVEVYGEKPAAHDFKSAIRCGLWWCTKKILKAYVTIERGTGRKMWKHSDIFEPRIFAVGRKPK
jgi:cyclopropane fatty-acyl-phospholipid synthase-like methyltransferase